MANVPSQRWTVLDVLSMARELAKTVDQQRVISQQGKYIYNLALSEIASLLNGASDPSYFTSAPLAPASTIVIDKTATWSGSGGAGSTIDFTFTGGLSGIGVGSLISGAVVFTSGGLVHTIVGRIMNINSNTASVYIVAGTVPSYSESYYYFHCNIEKDSTGLLSANIANINYDKIIALVHSTYGLCVNVSPNEFFSIQRQAFPHASYVEDIIWCQSGNEILLRAGSKCTSGGTYTLYYHRQPTYPTNYDNTEYVDLADKWIPLLVKRIYTFCILQTENDIPKNLAQEMQLDYQQISGFTTSEIANKMKRNDLALLAQRNQ
jgi:hypothetical protein